MASQPKHIVGHAAVAWGEYSITLFVTASLLIRPHLLVGHTRPLINLSARITKLRSNVYVTLLILRSRQARAGPELRQLG